MKILYVTTVGGTMGFFQEHFKMLLNTGNTIELACNTSSPVCDGVNQLNLPIYNIEFSRSPLSKDNIKAYRQLKILIKKGKYDIVHCHTPNAAAATRLACRGFRKHGLKVIYTAHGFHFYKGAPMKNWLLFFPVEWVCSFWTDKLITINQEDYHLAQKYMHAAEVFCVPGVGFNESKFTNKREERSVVRKELGLTDNQLALLSVGELNTNKNHRIIIEALAKLEDPNVQFFIAGSGAQKEAITALAASLGIESQLHLLGFRSDVERLYQAADIFCLPSLREGLPVSMMEAMASGLPVVCSSIRGSIDLIDEDGGALFAPCSLKETTDALKKVLYGDHTAMGRHNHDKVKKFNTEAVLKHMRKIYGIDFAE